jgi:hypothetical protein
MLRLILPPRQLLLRVLPGAILTFATALASADAVSDALAALLSNEGCSAGCVMLSNRCGGYGMEVVAVSSEASRMFVTRLPCA